MDKPTPAAVTAFDTAFPTDERAVRKKMFGMPAGFVNGNMFLGVWANGVVLRLDDAGRSELSRLAGVGPFEPMEGRPWKDYVLADVGTCPAEDLAAWARRALEHTAQMPAKVPKPRKKA